MIIGQILVNGVAFSCHRYPETRYNVPRVKQLLNEVIASEDLYALGKVDILVHSQRGLERLMAALWGKAPAHIELTPEPIERPLRQAVQPNEMLEP
jgi:hypothetical protein